MTDLRLTMVPFLANHAMRLFDVPILHKDPFDRMLIATALELEVPIVTPDKAIKQYPGVHVIW
jgi:PIN domain nuclease of toxin-antitoxin system